MAVLKIFSVIAALAASPGIFFMFNTAHFRASRLKVLLGNPIQECNLKNAPYVKIFMNEMPICSTDQQKLILVGGVT